MDQIGSESPAYLDCAATAPVEPEVAELVVHHMVTEYGNAGSRTHTYGTAAKRAVERARRQVAAVVDASAEDIVFTSGATEADNLAILGLAPYGQAEQRSHILTTAIEHKAVLEPIAVLAKAGFDVEFVAPDSSGAVAADAILSRIRSDTLLVSIMQVNNETGIRQPIAAVADGLADHPAYLHVDAAQGYGKDLDGLRHGRIDLIALSGHKIHAPKGIGALVARRRGRTRPPLSPLVHGGGQERGLRPGTLPVPLVAGLGLAAELAVGDHGQRVARCRAIREELLHALTPLAPRITGDERLAVPNILNVAFPGVDAEAVILVLQDIVAISNGSACTSELYEPSHVLRAMNVDDEHLNGAVRLSWSHLTPDAPYAAIAAAIATLC